MIALDGVAGYLSGPYEFFFGAPMFLLFRALEINLETALNDMGIEVCSGPRLDVCIDIVEHLPGVRVEMPVYASCDGVHLSARDGTIIQVQ